MPFPSFGPSGETRTRGILLPKQARYQLRYTRMRIRNELDYTPSAGKKQSQIAKMIIKIPMEMKIKPMKWKKLIS